jgi:hypothetical protein
MGQKDLLQQISQIQKEKEKLLEEIYKLKRKPGVRVGYFFIFFAMIILLVAIIYSNNVAAIIGLALIFWGAILLFIKPTKFVRKDILNSIVSDIFVGYNNILSELDYHGTPQYISPNTMWGLRNTVLYIPQKNDVERPSDEQLSDERMFIENMLAIKFKPLGQGLSRLIEEELKTNFSTVNIEYLQNNLEKAIVESLEIAKGFDLRVNKSKIYVDINESIFYEMIQNENKYENQKLIGDIFTNAIACVLSRTIRKPIVIENIQIKSDDKKVISTFRILEK